MVFQTCGPVQEISIKRACRALDLRMALNGHLSMPFQHLLFWSFWRGIHPGGPCDGPPVFLFYPSCTFPRMLSGHRPPEQTYQVCIAYLELLLGHDRSIVPRPPQNDRVELINEFLLREEL